MSIALNTVVSILIGFVNDNFIPVLDKNNLKYPLCIQKWQQLVESVLKNISNFKNQDELKQKIKEINKVIRTQGFQKVNIKKEQSNTNVAGPPHATFEQTEKNIYSKPQQMVSSKLQARKSQQTIQFCDRKTSVDELASRKQMKDNSELNTMKQQRPNSFHASLQGDISVQIPLVLTPKQQKNQRQRSCFMIPKQNQVLSFKSISDFHKNRNNLPSTITQVKQVDIQPSKQTVDPKFMSRRSIDESGQTSITQNCPNSYNTNYDQSIKKAHADNPSPSKRTSSVYSQINSSRDHSQNGGLKIQYSDQTVFLNKQQGPSQINLKKKLSQTEQFTNSPKNDRTSTDSFSKFMNSFKKLCNTFQSNHQKLLRQDFNNKYINC